MRSCSHCDCEPANVCVVSFVVSRPFLGSTVMGGSAGGRSSTARVNEGLGRNKIHPSVTVTIAFRSSRTFRRNSARFSRASSVIFSRRRSIISWATSLVVRWERGSAG
jgi:hypothetical protein